jgi:hypothetical protein
MLEPDDAKELDEYLKDLELFLDHLTIDQRNSVIDSIRQEVNRALSGGAQGLQLVLDSLGNEFDLVNRHLVQAGLPKATNVKKRNILKVVILSLSTITIVGIITVFLLVKSILPLWDFNEEEMSLTLLGGKYRLDQTDDTFFSTTRLKKSGVHLSKIEISGEIPIQNVNRLRIVGQKVDLAFRSHDSASLVYQCKTTETPKKLINQTTEGIDLKLVGSSQCLFQFPPTLPVVGVFKNGFVNLKDLQNDLDLSLVNGNINWKQADKSIYSLKAKVVNGEIDGDTDVFPDESTYKAQMAIQNGVLKIIE